MDARKPTRQRRGLLRDERGSILIEFAFIGPLFILLLLGMLELALMVFSQTVLDGAARQAGRTVRTGHAQFSGVSTFTTALCSGLAAIPGLVPCGSVVYNVQTYPTFNAAFNATPAFYDVNGNPLPPVFTPGGPSTINVVKVVYHRKFITRAIGNLLGLIGHTSRSTAWDSASLESTVVFQTEPYNATTGP
jgi:Flp pilus assembly protein TadG